MTRGWVQRSKLISGRSGFLAGRWLFYSREFRVSDLGRPGGLFGRVVREVYYSRL